MADRIDTHPLSKPANGRAICSNADRAAEVASEVLGQRSAKAKPGALERHLNDAPDVPPMPGDELLTNDDQSADNP